MRRALCGLFDRRRRSANRRVRFFAVRGDVEPCGFFTRVARSGITRPISLSTTNVPDAAVEHGAENGRALKEDLAGIAEQRAVERAVQRLLGEHAGEQRAHRAAEAVRGHDIERVVQRRLRAQQDAEVARNRRDGAERERTERADVTRPPASPPPARRRWPSRRRRRSACPCARMSRIVHTTSVAAGASIVVTNARPADAGSPPARCRR